MTGKPNLNNSTINWKVLAYTVGVCWLIFALMMLLLGKQLAMFLNPFPIVIKGVFGILVFGYVGSTSGGDIEAIFIYWTLVGLGLSWLFHKIKRQRAVIIACTAMLHLVLAALALFPMMLFNGR